MTSPALCDDCRSKIYAWQDTKPSVLLGGGIRFHSHAAYDDTPAGMRANWERRWRDWRDLVEFQSELIRGICARQHQAGQTALFELDVAA